MHTLCEGGSRQQTLSVSKSLFPKENNYFHTLKDVIGQNNSAVEAENSNLFSNLKMAKEVLGPMKCQPRQLV